MKWPQVTLDEISTTQYGYTASASHEEIGPKFLRITDIVPDSIDWNSVPFCHIDEDSYARYALAPGDIVVARTGATVGYAKLIRHSIDAVFASYLVRFRITDSRALKDYIGLAVESAAYKSFVKGNVGGAAQPNANAKVLARFPLKLPPLAVQTAIVSILSAYDDLVENNRRRIALLEEAARLLYREWFIHLRFPGHEHVKVVDSVPEGWARKSLGEVADCRLGKMLDQNKNKGDLMPYLANVNVRWGAIDLDDLRQMRFEDDELDTFGLRYGDIVMCEGGEPGRCALWKEQLPSMMIQKAIHRIRAYPEVRYSFLYQCLRHKGQSGQLAPLFTGATIKHLPGEKLAIVQVDIPPVPLMTLFAEQVEVLEKQITLLEGANRRASQARDLLLPRLISGEIAV